MKKKIVTFNEFLNNSDFKKFMIDIIAVSSTVVAFGDELEVEKSTKIVDELGNKHHLYTFV